MIRLLPGRGNDPFLAYFNEHWDNCKDKWVNYERANIRHLGNNTDNQLESAWGKLKPELELSTPLDQAIQTIVASQAVKDKEFDMRNRVGEVWTG